jgi:hypothetical protein
MSFFSKLGGMFDKLDDIIYEPIKLVTDWAREPLKNNEHKRSLEKLKLEKRINSEIRMSEESLKTDLEIKRETEKVRIITEIDEWKKDQEFSRMQKVSESIIKFQSELTKINVDAINEIGNMQLELREKAQNLVYSKTIKYKELQDIAMKDAMVDLKKIDDEFGHNKTAKNILIKAVDARLSNIIDTAHNFLLELNNDIRSLNKNIDLLTSSGQKFIERHLDQFNSLGLDQESLRKLKDHSSDTIEDAEIVS